MGRKNKYETHVKPFLDKIKKWYETMTEAQIAQKLGVSVASFENYKIQYEELRECLRSGKTALVEELKETLKKKALGYEYEEQKSLVREEDGQVVLRVVEKYKRYAHPDTGAIHLLLKNYDEDWHNDDAETIKQKRKALDITQQKADNME